MCGCDEAARWTRDVTCHCTTCHPDGPIVLPRPTLEEWVEEYGEMKDYAISTYNAAGKYKAERDHWKKMYLNTRKSKHADGMGPGARSTDPLTSHLAAEDVRVRAGTQRALMLYAYQYGHELLDVEASMMADVDPESCWWKRSSELRQGGFIEVVNFRVGPRGSRASSCRITKKGLAELGMLERTSDVS